MVIDNNVQELWILCPDCSEVMEMDCAREKCANCGKQLLIDGNIYDFVGAAVKENEKDFYDSEYEKQRAGSQRKTLEDLAVEWERPDAPQDTLVLEALGSIKSKTVVMLGNGASRKELFFLKKQPRKLVYSDLSPNASKRIKADVDCAGYDDVLRFAAIDAEHLPFVDSSIDIVYAYAMVHHLPNLEQFFGEVMRVLKPGGRAVFMDDAYSPIWHHSKQTWLRPLMKKSHSRTGISPEDYRFSMTGGFREQSLTKSIQNTGGKPFFKRTAFLGYLVGRAAAKLLPQTNEIRNQREWVQKVANNFDNRMSTFKLYRQQQIRLIWGFEK